MIFISPVYASCPVCIATVGGGLFLAKKLGIDDLLVSLWISGLNSAIAFYIAAKIKNKRANNPILWSLVFYLITVIYLSLTSQIGHPNNIVLGIDKVLFGLTIGFAVFISSFFLDKIMRKNNKGKIFFPYQKVVIPAISLAGTTIFFKLLFGL